MGIRSRSFVLGMALASGSLAGCAGHAANGSFVPLQAPDRVQTAPLSLSWPLIGDVNFDAGPPRCKGQQTLKDHATDKETLLTTGGSICVPAFGGFGGKIQYPPANPSVGVTLISSTTNYNGQLPSLHSGSPIFYLQLATTGATTFGSSVRAGGGLTGASIKVGNTYTVYGQAKIDGFTFNFTPCYAVATKGRYGGVIGGVGTLLKGQNVPGAASGVIEIYSGQSAGGKC